MSVCFVALFMTLLDISVVNVALPSIGHSTGAGPSQLQWVVSGYVLSFGLVPVLAGRFGDQHGRRPLLLAGVGGFVLTSALVGLAPNPVLLLAGRFLQGLAGGVINPQVAGLIQELFPGRDRGRAFGALGTVVGVSTATGPVVGGLVIAAGGPELGWRLVFFLNVPIGLVAMVLARRWLPAPPPRRAGPPVRLDIIGAWLLGCTVLLVLLAAIQYGDTRQPAWTLVALPAPVVAVVFLRWERRVVARGGHPLVDLRLFSIRSYSFGVLVALTFFCAFPGVPFVLALYFQDGLGYSPLQSGLSVTAFAVGSAIAAAVSGRLLRRYGRLVTLTALGLFAVGIVAMEAIARYLATSASGGGGGAPGAGTGGVSGGVLAGMTVGLLLAPALFLAGLGSGGVITPNQALSLAEVEVSGGGTAAGMLQTAQRIGSAIGPALVGAVFFATLGARRLLPAAEGATSTGTAPSTGGAASTGVAGPGAVTATREGFAAALGNGLLVSLGFALLALVLSMGEVNRRRGRSSRSGSRAGRSTGRRCPWRAGPGPACHRTPTPSTPTPTPAPPTPAPPTPTPTPAPPTPAPPTPPTPPTPAPPTPTTPTPTGAAATPPRSARRRRARS
jgi:MFS family permease